MLKITCLAGEPAIRTLKLEGKLVGPWVDELADACRQGNAPGADLRLDLCAVSYADSAGVRLLRELLGRGVTVVCSGLIAELLSWEGR
jgi:hypothetical protein